MIVTPSHIVFNCELQALETGMRRDAKAFLAEAGIGSTHDVIPEYNRKMMRTKVHVRFDVFVMCSCVIGSGRWGDV